MARIFGDDQDNALTGTGAADAITGAGGDDHVDGLAGRDELFGEILRLTGVVEAGDDQLAGGAGTAVELRGKVGPVHFSDSIIRFGR